MNIYDGLSRSDRELLKDIEADIRSHAADLAEHAVEMGKKFIKAHAVLGKHKFSPWLALNFSISRATAYRYISLAREYGDCLTVRQLGPGIAEMLVRPSTTEEGKEAVLDAMSKAEERGEKLTRDEAQDIIALCKATADEERVEEVEDDEEEDSQDEPEPAVESDLEDWKQEQVEHMEEQEFRDEELRKGISQMSAGLKHMATSRLVRQPILDVLHSGLGKVRAILARREKKSRPEYTKHKRGRAG